MTATSDLLWATIALFLPPLPVALRKGLSAHLLLNTILFLLAWIPGVLHAWYIIYVYNDLGQKKKDRKLRRASAEQRVGALEKVGQSAVDEKEGTREVSAEGVEMGMGNQQGYYGPLPPSSEQQQRERVVSASEPEIQPVQARQEPPEYARDVKQGLGEMQSPGAQEQPPPEYPRDMKM